MIEIKNFISLKTKNKLSLNERKTIYKIFKKLNYDHLIFPLQIYKDGKFKFSFFFVKKDKKENFYITKINLSRDLSVEEFNKIRDELYKNIPNIIFVSFSSKIKKVKKIKKNKNIFNDIVEIISKKYHNNYIMKKTEKKWRYGNIFSLKDKMDPNLLPWEQLTEKRKNKIRKMVKFILKEIKNYKI